MIRAPLVLVAGSYALLLGVACEPAPFPELKNGLTDVEHAPYFPITAGEVHALGRTDQLSTASSPSTISCTQCHLDTASFKEFRCLVCHERDTVPLGTVHGAIAGYQPVDARCLECHEQSKVELSEQGVEEHSTLWFPIDDGIHSGPTYDARIDTLAGQDSCTACHNSVEDRTDNRCAQCHEADTAPTIVEAHASAGANTPSETLNITFLQDTSSVGCKSCHAEIPMLDSMSPLEGPQGHERDEALQRVEANHFSVRQEEGCTDCHDQKKAAPDEREWSTDWGFARCTLCHAVGGTCRSDIYPSCDNP